MYEQKLQRANNLFEEISHCMREMELREKALLKREQDLYNLLKAYGIKRSKPARQRVMRGVLAKAGPSHLRGLKTADLLSQYGWSTACRGHFADEPLE